MTFRTDQLITNNPPEIIFLENTNICNLKCVMCPLKDMERKNFNMDFKHFKDIADQIKIFGSKTRLNFYFFGESFVHKNALGMIGYCKNIGIEIHFSTNLLALTEDQICTWISMLDEKDKIVLSLDAFSKEDYEKIRIGGSYEKLCQNFHWILREHTRKKNKPELIIQAIYNWIPEKFGTIGLIEKNENPQKVNNFLEVFLQKVWTEIGKKFTKKDIDEFIKIYYEEYEKGHSRREISEKILVYIKDVDDWAAQIGDRKTKEQLGQHQLVCDFPWRNLIVQANGDVTVCCKDVEGKINVGNTHRNTLQEIWNGEEIQNLRKEFIGFKRQNLLCKHC